MLAPLWFYGFSLVIVKLSVWEQFQPFSFCKNLFLWQNIRQEKWNEGGFSEGGIWGKAELACQSRFERNMSRCQCKYFEESDRFPGLYQCWFHRIWKEKIGIFSSSAGLGVWYILDLVLGKGSKTPVTENVRNGGNIPPRLNKMCFKGAHLSHILNFEGGTSK